MMFGMVASSSTFMCLTSVGFMCASCNGYWWRHYRLPMSAFRKNEVCTRSNVKASTILRNSLGKRSTSRSSYLYITQVQQSTRRTTRNNQLDGIVGHGRYESCVVSDRHSCTQEEETRNFRSTRVSMYDLCPPSHIKYISFEICCLVSVSEAVLQGYQQTCTVIRVSSTLLDHCIVCAV